MRGYELMVRMGFITGAVIIVMSIVVLFYPPDFLVEKGIPPFVLSAILLLYGAFRIWRARVMQRRLRKKP
ncbi:MAG: C4-dicarboxylate ABC transporter [Bacteroidetes bacterium]|nr:C4-dicarboxylate ABC transporter [Bacteroidota bacterium]